MKIRMNVDLSGLHDGQRWPARGGEAVVDDRTGADMCANGFAEPVAERKVEKATARRPETRKR
ncbi:MAG TPA: hypothetical protein VN088_16220 [Nocardioides sp.]|nr:hypothetical protein [Nocardioides sp.]